MGEDYTIDFDRDQPKHFIRLEQWLPVARLINRHVESQRRRKLRSRQLKYLTLCATRAVDVFMLEKERILRRDKTRQRLETAWFCAGKEREFTEIKPLFGGGEDSGFQEWLEKLFNFSPSANAEAFRLKREELPPLEIREELRQWDQHDRFKSIFPLDLVNFDLCGSLVPPSPTSAHAWEPALNHLFEWQKAHDKIDGHSCDRFALLLTTSLNRNPEEMDHQKTQELLQTLDANTTAYPSFREATQQRFPAVARFVEVSEDEFERVMCLAIPKTFLLRNAVVRGWRSSDRRVALYWRETQEGNRYSMLAASAIFERMPVGNGTDEVAYEKQLLDWANTDVSQLPSYERIDEMIAERPRHFYRFSDPETATRCEEDLVSIRSFREKRTRELRLASANPSDDATA